MANFIILYFRVIRRTHASITFMYVAYVLCIVSNELDLK